MARRIMKVLLMLLALSISLIACTFAEDKGTADRAVDEYIQTIRDKDFKRALTFYDSQFFEKTSRDDWIEILMNVNLKLGDLESYEIMNWKAQTSTGLPLQGTFFTYRLKVKYAKYLADEDLVLFKPAGSTTMKIIGYHISSEGFLK